MTLRPSAAVVLLVSVLLAKSDVRSQPRVISWQGHVNLSSEVYSASGIPARRPTNTQRGSLQFSLNVLEQVQLPFEFYFSSGQSGFRQPFNQFGVNPRISDWLTLHAGYFSSRLSDLTFGDARLLGGGIDVRPGPFRFSALFGRSQAAIQPDSALGITGTYKRTMWGGKIGYGKENEFFVDLNLWHAVDDTASLFRPPVGVAPNENIVTSLALGVPLADILTMNAEVAASAFSNDTRSSELVGKGIGRSLFVPRISSQVDMAAKVSLAVMPVSFVTVRLTTQWVGPGFQSLGFAQFPSDVFEWTIAPQARLLNNKLNVRGSLGQRQNNLRSNRLSTTRRTIWSLGSNWQATDQLGLDVQYSNYGMRSTARDDTLRIENVSQSVSVSPRYMFEAFDANNAVVLSSSFQDVEDKNAVTSQTNRNQTQSTNLVWAVNFPSTLSFSTSFLWTSSKLPALTTSVFTISETVGYAFFENLLTTSASIGYGSIKAASSDGQFTFSLSAGYSIGAWGNFTFSLFRNSYDFGSVTSGTSFREVQGSLSYGVGF